MCKIVSTIIITNNRRINSQAESMLLFRDGELECRVYGRKIGLYREYPQSSAPYPLDRAILLDFEYGVFKNVDTARQHVGVAKENIGLLLLRCGFSFYPFPLEAQIEESDEFYRLACGEQAEVTTGTSITIDRFIDIFPDGKSLLAVNILHAANSISHPPTSFILHVIAIESLCDNEVEPERVRLLVDRMISMAEELDDGNRESLKGRLRELKNKSIRKSCRSLIEKYAKEKTYSNILGSKLFDDCYFIRSSYVHEGEFDYSAEVAERFEALKILTHDVLVGYIIDQNKIKSKK